MWREERCRVCFLILGSRLSQSLGYRKEKGHCIPHIKMSGGYFGLYGASKISPPQASFVFQVSQALRDRTGNAASFEYKERISLCIVDQHFTEDIKTWFLRAVSLGFGVSDSKAGITARSRRWARGHCCVRTRVHRPTHLPWLPWLLGGASAHVWVLGSP